MKEEILYKAIDINDRLPEMGSINFVLLGSKSPMMAQLRPDGWFTLGFSEAKKIPKGVSHWLELV
jgi:hypothetical protein